MDPSMLLAFLVRDEHDWEHWKENVGCVQGKAIIHVSGKKPGPPASEREGAIDEVESFDERDDDDEGEDVLR